MEAEFHEKQRRQETTSTQGKKKVRLNPEGTGRNREVSLQWELGCS